MKTFYKTLSKSWTSFYNNFRSAIIIILVDLAFFVCSAIVYTKVWEKIMASTDAIMAMMGITMEEFADVQTEAQLRALSSQYGNFMVHYQNIGYYLGMLFVAILIFWCVFQGISWFLTNEAVGKKKEKFIKYMAKFSVFTIIWWSLSLLAISLGMKLSMDSSMGIMPFAGKAAATAVTLALMLAIFYIAYTSYAIIPHHGMRGMFQALFRQAAHYKTLAPAYIFIVMLLLAEYLAFMKFFAFGGTAAGIFAVLILSPTIAWSRFYAVELTEKK